MSEYDEMCVVADYLNFRRHFWIHVPNEGKRSVVTGARLKRIGMQAGVPDIIVFTATERAPHGCMIELKATKKNKPTATQTEFLRRAVIHGWQARVCYGATDALNFLKSLGY